MHHRRTFSVTTVESAEELARTLTEYTWTLCTGFRLGGYLFLNDSTSEDGAQEYVVLREPGGSPEPYRQVESITFSWCSYEQALGYVRRVLDGEFDGQGLEVPAPHVEDVATHEVCRHCA
jgi:hypothetical protein